MYIQPKIEDRIKKLFSVTKRSMVDTLGITFTSFKEDEVKATMPVDENTIQPFGILHGGASVALAETVASIGAWLNVKEEEKTAVGIEINANHLRAIKKGGDIQGVAIPIHRGRQTQVWETKIYNQDEKLVCLSRCTLAIIDQ